MIDKTFDKILENAFKTNYVGFVPNTFPPKTDTYPPHNIVKYSETEFQIQLAVAGFPKSSISVSQDKNVLVIESHKIDEEVTKEYLHRGIASRAFKKEFILSEYIEVSNVSQRDGILVIDLKKIIPEDKKPRTFNIN